MMIMGLGLVVTVASALVMAGIPFPFGLERLFRIIGMVLTGMALALLLSFVTSRMAKKFDYTPRREDDYLEYAEADRTDEVRDIRVAIADYLAENESTPFFIDTLSHISTQLDSFRKRCNSAHAVLENRFGMGGLSFNKFSSSVLSLQSYLMKLVENLLAKMEAFDAEDYEKKINRFLQQNRLEEAEAHKAVEKEYKSYAESVTKQLDAAILRMDKLILEMAKLSDGELEKAMSALCNMDDTIDHTRLYGT